MNVNLLGPVEILPDIGAGDLKRVKERCLLAVLALTPEQVVMADTLIVKVWDDEALSDAVRGTLRTYMSRVKAAVAAAGGARVDSARGGYVLRIDRENVDVHRFRRLVAQAESIARSGDAEHAASLLREAEGLWRDHAFADLPGRWIAGMRHTLDAERRRAAKMWTDLEFGLGRHEELVGELRQFAERYPFDETWVQYQMMALCRSGRQTDALALYRDDYERRIELGLDPGPGLSALQQRILNNDPSLFETPSRRRSSPQKPWRSGLPPRPAMFVGRDKELSALCEIPETQIALVRVIDGMGGSGKTTLAVEAAMRLRASHPDPPIFLSFRSHEAGHAPLDAAEVLRQLLELAGLASGPLPQSAAVLSAMWQREVAHRRSVIVLDDVPDPAVVVPVLPVSGSCLTFVTSRGTLTGLPASVVVTLEELPLDNAIALFAQTAGPEGIDDPDLLPRAVRLCGCLPLALTLSASRLRDEGSTVTEFVAEIEERRAFPDRVGVIDARLLPTFERSYAGLDTVHQKFFRRLGLNPCPNFSSRTAAVIVGSTVADAESALGVLHGRHLIERSVADMFRFHDLIREYAAFVAERDDPDWKRRRAERRLLDHYVATASKADRLIYPYRRHVRDDQRVAPFADGFEITSAAEAVKWFELEWRNAVRLANYAAHHEWQHYCVDLAHSVGGFLEERSYWNEGIDLHRVAVRMCRDLGDSLPFARAMNDLGLLELRTGNYSDALARADEALNIYRSEGQENGAADGLDRIGAIHRFMGQGRPALAHHLEALGIYRKLHDEHGIAEALCNAGAAYYSLGRYEESIGHHERALALYKTTRDKRGEAKSYNNIGDALCQQGRYDEAASNLEKAIILFGEVGARQDLATVRLNLGHVAQSKGRYHQAIAAYRAALNTCRETGDLRHQAAALYDTGTAYQEQEHYDQALVHHQRAEVIAKDLGDLSMQAIVNLGIADALSGSGSYAAAMEHYNCSLELALRTEDLLQKAKVLEGMAETRRRMRDFSSARILFREALDAFRAAGVPQADHIALRLTALDA